MKEKGKDEHEQTPISKQQSREATGILQRGFEKVELNMNIHWYTVFKILSMGYVLNNSKQAKLSNYFKLQL
jgi:hypothetical protein